MVLLFYVTHLFASTIYPLFQLQSFQLRMQIVRDPISFAFSRVISTHPLYALTTKFVMFNCYETPPEISLCPSHSLLDPFHVYNRYTPPPHFHYNTSGAPVEGKINVHLVPHTHDDTGSSSFPPKVSPPATSSPFCLQFHHELCNIYTIDCKNVSPSCHERLFHHSHFPSLGRLHRDTTVSLWPSNSTSSP